MHDKNQIIDIDLEIPAPISKVKFIIGDIEFVRSHIDDYDNLHKQYNRDKRFPSFTIPGNPIRIIMLPFKRRNFIMLKQITCESARAADYICEIFPDEGYRKIYPLVVGELVRLVMPKIKYKDISY